MFQFPGCPLPRIGRSGTLGPGGFPIRGSPDLSLRAAPRSLSWRATPFIGRGPRGIPPRPSSLPRRTLPSSSLSRCGGWGTLKTGQRGLLRKEVIQPHLPVRLPCYDLAPLTDRTLGVPFPGGVRGTTSGAADSGDLTGGVYKARERIHRRLADRRLLAIPASRSRVADCDPN